MQQHLVFHGGRYTVFIQIIRNSPVIITLDAHIKNISDHFRRHRIDHQFSFSFLISEIAIHRKASCIIPALLPHLYLASHLDGNIPAVGVVHKVFEGQEHIVCLTVHMPAVIVVIDGNKPHSHKGKNLLYVSSCLDIIAAKAG